MILTLITLGKFLETRSKGKTGEAITRLMDLAPKTASVLRDGTHGGGGPHRDQGVHIGRAAEEGLEAHLIIFVVEVHDL